MNIVKYSHKEPVMLLPKQSKAKCLGWLNYLNIFQNMVNLPKETN